jgi:outer membrane protein OmpA-like peptidoglycan-associated protein
MSDLKGYPVRLTIERMGRMITVSGLAPSVPTHDDAIKRITAAAHGARIVDQLSVLPSDLAEVEPKIARVKQDVEQLGPEVARIKDGVAGLEPRLDTVRIAVTTLEADMRRAELLRAIGRAQGKLNVLRDELPALAQLAGNEPLSSTMKSTSDAINGIAGDLEKLTSELETGKSIVEFDAIKASLDGCVSRLRAVAGSFGQMIGAPRGLSAAPAAATGPSDAVESADGLSAEIERISAMVVAAAHVTAYKNSLPQPTPRERLDKWVRTNAVFFGNNVDYREPERVERTLDELAALIRESGVFVRVVGYTDEKGGQARNSPLSQARADKVREALISRSIPADRLMAVGRLDGIDISNVVGEASANRRVEFELGFEGEARP